jgi:hypothetical protein
LCRDTTTPLFAGLGFLRWGDYFIEPNAQSHASSHIPHSLLPLIAVFWPRKVIQIFLKYIWRQKNTTIPHSPFLPLLFFVMKSNSNNFEIYLATKNIPYPAPPVADFCHEK